jgi:transposase
MPWKECHVEDERLQFVARLLEGEQMSALCGAFGISRKTGYKIYERYKQWGIYGLTDRSRRPYRHAKQLPQALETQIVTLKKEFPDWGAPKFASGCGAWASGSDVRRSARFMWCSDRDRYHS